MFIEADDLRPVPLHQGAVFRVLREAVQNLLQFPLVAQTGAEMHPALSVLFHQLVVALDEKPAEKPSATETGSRKVVPLQKKRKPAVRVKEIAVLVPPIHRTSPQGAKNPHRLFRRKQAGAENGHLALQHFVKMPDGDPLPPLKREKIIGMVQAVLPSILPQTVVDPGDGQGKEAQNLFFGEGSFSGR
ncbi:MAG: hypothetical protein EBT95_07380, partial [Verrucomicrobia bacterium]|nr:hypothetical protein [Verrucomicrobiota bacterium]